EREAAIEGRRRDAGRVDEPLDGPLERERTGHVVAQEFDVRIRGEVLDTLRQPDPEVVEGDDVAGWSYTLAADRRRHVEEIAPDEPAGTGEQQRRAGERPQLP